MTHRHTREKPEESTSAFLPQARGSSEPQWACKGVRDGDQKAQMEQVALTARKGQTQVFLAPKPKGEKERYTYLNAEFQRIARRDKKAFLGDQCKEIEENDRMGKTRDLFKKMRDTKGTFHAKKCYAKKYPYQKWYGPNRSRRY